MLTVGHIDRTLEPMITHTLPAHPDLFLQGSALSLPLDKFPMTRYQGSKRRLLGVLARTFQEISPGSAVDLYSGTSTVSLLLRLLGFRVISNDFLKYNNITAKVMLGSIPKNLTSAKAAQEIKYLLEEATLKEETLVAKNFENIYFYNEENLQIDRFCQNVIEFDEQVANIYRYAVGQALLMKRPYNLFHRANLNMRARSVERSFGNVATWNAPISSHAVKIVTKLIGFPFPDDSKNHHITSQNTLRLDALPDLVDMIYLDPPYLNGSGIGVDYCQFYHFLDGLVDYKTFDKYDNRYPHRPIVSNPSAWNSNAGALDELSRILQKWQRSTIVLSYRNDGKPNLEQIKSVFQDHGRKFNSIDQISLKYALSHKDSTKELVLISPPT